MKRLLSLVALILCATSPIFARQKLQGYCEQGGKTVVTSGLTSTTNVQQSFPSCTVTVFIASTVTPATIYSDNNGTVKGNPLTADVNGYWFAYADNGRYDIRKSGGGILTPFTEGDYLLDDNAEQTFVVNPLSFTATPTFDASLFSIFQMTLTGNVTSSTITNPKTGRVIGFQLCEDGVGGRTFVWPGTFDSPPTIDTRASKCSTSFWEYNGATWKRFSAGGDALSLAANSIIYNGAAALTLPTTTDTLMGRATTDTMLNKTMSGGSLSGAITATGATITGGTFSGPTLSGAITATGSTITGGTLSGATFSGGTFAGTIAGTPTFSGAINMSNTLTVVGQIVSTAASPTPPLVVASTGPIPNLTPMRINSSTVVNTANPSTLTFANPAAPRVVNLSDFGRDGYLLETGSPGTIDCDTSDATCNMNEYYNVTLGNCTSLTTAVADVSIVSSDPAVPTCVNGANLGFFTLNLPAAFTQLQTQTGNNGAGAGTVTTTYSAAVGHLLVAVTSSDGNQTVTGCTDGTNAYTLAVRSNNVGNDTVEIWFKQNSTAVSGVTLTCTYSGSVKGSVTWAEYTGALTAGALDVTISGTGNDASPTTPNTAGLAAAPSLLIGAVAAKNTPVITSPSGGFIQNPTAAATGSPTVAMQTKVPPSTSGQNTVFTLNAVQQWAAAAAVFKAATTGITYSRITIPVRVPDDFSGGTLDVKFGFRTALASLSNAQITLGVATTCVADGAALDQALNAESTQQNSALAQVNGGANTTSITSIDVTGCTAGKHLFLSIFRKRGTSGDQTVLPAELTTFQYKLRASK